MNTQEILVYKDLPGQMNFLEPRLHFVGKERNRNSDDCVGDAETPDLVSPRPDQICDLRCMAGSIDVFWLLSIDDKI